MSNISSFTGSNNHTVRFREKPILHNMLTWTFAYRQARRSEWMQNALDRDRFRMRLKYFYEPLLQPILDYHLQRLSKISESSTS